MKLRNKETGKVVNCKFIIYNEPKDDADYFMPLPSSLIEFNELWEDTEEPLIKDEKIRKAVRAWAELLLTNEIHVARYDCMTVFRDEKTGYRLEIVTDDIQHGLYTIAELCGEEDNEN